MRNFAFPSSGDAQKDAEFADEFELTDRRIREGMCPNGCGPMTPKDAHEQDCPKCGFHHWQNTPRVGMN